MPDVLPRLPVGCSWSWRYSKNQTAIFAPLTAVNRPHHQARGFDQARELDRARHSKLMIPNSWTAPRVTEPTFDCSNSVINRGQSRQEYVCGGCLRGDGGGDSGRVFGRCQPPGVGPGQAKPRNQHSPNQVGFTPASRREPRAGLVRRRLSARSCQRRWQLLARKTDIRLRI